MEYFRIGEFAKRCGTTVEFLKFYDREGLISPVWKDESGYRYYADYQMVHFAELYKLSRMGFSTEEAKQVHSTCSLQELEDCLMQRRVGLAAEIADQQTALTYLDDLLTTINHLRQKDCWFIELMPDSYFCVHSIAHTQDSAKPWWKDGFELPEVWQRADWIDAGNRDTVTRKWGTLLYDREQAADKRFESVTLIPAGRCFLYWYSVPAEYDKNTPRLSDNVWNLKEPLSILRAHNLEPRGDFYQRRMFVTHEENGSLVHILTRIPLK